MEDVLCLVLPLLLRYGNEDNENEHGDGPKQQSQGEREGKL